MVAELIYTANVSLDGYVEDARGNFDWTAPSEEFFRFITALERPIGTYLYGRRLYETMVVWERPEFLARQPVYFADYAELWRAADKIVYSRTLDQPSSAKTRIERSFDPETIKLMKTRSPSDLSVGGSELAALAIKAGLVDEYRLFLYPILVGGGKRALPDGAEAGLELTDERRFRSGVVFLRYRTSRTWILAS